MEQYTYITILYPLYYYIHWSKFFPSERTHYPKTTIVTSLSVLLLEQFLYTIAFVISLTPRPVFCDKRAYRKH